MTLTKTRAGQAGSIAAFFVFSWLAGLVVHQATIGFDAPIRDLAQRVASEPLTAFMRTMSAIGEPQGLLLLGVAALSAMLVLRWRRTAWSFLILLAGAAVLDPALKLMFHRPRPTPFFGTPLPHSYSFPSGHALFAVCFFCGLAVLVRHQVSSRTTRAAIWAGAVAIAVSIGLSRIYLGVHYPSDVLGGFAVAVAWVGAARSIERLLRQRGAKDRAAETVPAIQSEE